ncbi:MAG TPA: O-antigen ligase family protein, partial [Terriglobia bacterium]|nr:O-antigen ligase family protein [Terriglobia bacterium]
MPPLIALFAGLCFVVWLLRKDVAFHGKIPFTFWIPIVWLLIKGSRPVALWLGMGAPDIYSGNPIDALIDFALIAVAFVIVTRRIGSWQPVVARNSLLFLLLGFFFVSLLWSPYPFVAFKRWFREFGGLLIALLVVTESNPADAFRRVAVRCAYILFPLSVVLARYFPQLGREYTRAGGAMITGVTQQKNSLGLICCVFGLALVWEILVLRKQRKEGNAPRAIPQWLVLSLGLWLLFSSRSQTSLTVLMLGVALLCSTYVGVIRRHEVAWARWCIFAVTAGLILVTVATVIFAPLLEFMGRDATFTERTTTWNFVLSRDVNFFVGTGFYSFWLLYGTTTDLNFFVGSGSAHNGYLETYLDGGIIGSSLLILFLLVTALKLAKGFSHEDPFRRVIFALVIMLIVANYTETYVLRLNVLWFAVVFASFIPGHLLAEENVRSRWERSPRIG